MAKQITQDGYNGADSMVRTQTGTSTRTRATTRSSSRSASGSGTESRSFSRSGSGTRSSSRSASEGGSSSRSNSSTRSGSESGSRSSSRLSVQGEQTITTTRVPGGSSTESTAEPARTVTTQEDYSVAVSFSIPIKQGLGMPVTPP